MHLSRSIVLASISALTACNASKPPVDVAAVRAAISTLDRNVERWAAIGAADSVASGYYAPDAALLGANAPVAKGTDAIQKVWASYFAMGLIRIHLQATELVVADSLAVDRGTYTLEVRAKPPADTNNVLVADHGNYVTAFIQRGAKWLALYDISVTEVPLPPAAPPAKAKK
jgi:ketosteroid isomerase-like protein